jgi:hypothetical protein
MSDIYKNIAKKTWIWPLYIRWYIENENYELSKVMYNKFQYIMWWLEYEKKNINDFLEKFNNLIDDFSINWFNEDFPIIVSKELIPIDWHHRVACCLYFNILPKYKIKDSISIKNYNWLDWILNGKSLSKSFLKYEKIHILKEFNRYNNLWILIENKWNLKVLLNQLNNHNINIYGVLKINFKKESSIFKNINLNIEWKNSYLNIICINNETINNKIINSLSNYYWKNIEEQNILKDTLFDTNNIINLIEQESELFINIRIKSLHYINKYKRKLFEFLKKYL